MKYFWTFETDLPEGSGFELFGAAHIIWLIAGAVFAAAGAVIYLRRTEKARANIQFAVSLLIVFNEVFQDIYLKVNGHFDVYQLPLHLCGLAVFITLAHGIVLKAGFGSRKKSVKAADSFLGQVRYSLCLPGALLALIFPDWTVYPPFAFMSIFGFVNHILISASALWLILPDTFTIKPADILKPAVFLLVAVPLIYRFDVAENANYFFLIEGPEGSPLYWLQHRWPDHYLIAYAILAAVVISVWYAIGIIAKRKRNRGRN
ncbi:MAG: hypothetical protein ACOYJI_05755 [Anaerovoracaceae bacterium]|jgi:uncharacterized membrane protein YwaF